MKILIAFDGSESSEIAIADLERSGLPMVVDATVMTVTEFALLPTTPANFELVASAVGGHYPAQVFQEEQDWSTARISETLALADRGAILLRERFPHWRIATEACAGSPSSQILKRTQDRSPDLVVVGSHDRSRLGRFFLGSVSQRVVRDAAAPVRVGRARHGTDPHRLRIVVGDDGSADADDVLSCVAARRWPPRTEVRVVRVLQSIPLYELSELTPAVTDWMATSDCESRRKAFDRLDREVERLRGEGLSAEGVVADGDPRSVLVDEAESWKADSIFVGARGLDRVEQLLLGSVSSAVVLRAPCSVEVVRPRGSNAERRN